MYLLYSITSVFPSPRLALINVDETTVNVLKLPKFSNFDLLFMTILFQSETLSPNIL